jgi:hypothetical protein
MITPATNIIIIYFSQLGHSVAYWLRLCFRIRKIAVSRNGEIIEFFSNYLIHPATLGPGDQSAYNRNKYHKNTKVIFLGSKVWPVRKTDNLTATFEPIV